MHCLSIFKPLQFLLRKFWGELKPSASKSGKAKLFKNCNWCILALIWLFATLMAFFKVTSYSLELFSCFVLIPEGLFIACGLFGVARGRTTDTRPLKKTTLRVPEFDGADPSLTRPLVSAGEMSNVWVWPTEGFTGLPRGFETNTWEAVKFYDGRRTLWCWRVCLIKKKIIKNRSCC